MRVQPKWLERLESGGGYLFDDVAITAGLGTAIATDIIGGVNFQRNKLIYGPDGTNSGDVAAANGLPVQPQTGLGATPFPTVAGLKLTEQYSRAVISCAGAGDNTLVAAVASQFVRVMGILLVTKTPNDIKIGDSTPAYFSGAMTFVSGSGLFLPAYGEPYFITAVGKALVLNLLSAVQCSGVVWYQQGV